MVVKSRPFDIPREMERFLDALVAAPPAAIPSSRRGRLAFPAVNLWEDESNLHAEAELPGMTMGNVEVLATRDALTIRGSRGFTPPEGARPMRRERALGSFERTIALPVPIDAEQVEARLRDGVLSCRMPKAADFRGRRIEITAND